MKRKTILSVLLALGTGVFAQPLQLSKWFAAPNEIDLSVASPTTTNIAGAPSVGADGYNCWYENGKLLFYVFNSPNGAAVYTSNHVQIGQNLFSTGVFQGEVGIIPHHDNFTNLCSKKFWIIFNLKFGSNLTGDVFARLLDLNSTNPVSILYNFGQSNSNNVPIAISKLYANGERYIYLDYDGTGIKIFRLNSTGFSNYSSTGFISNGKEMELTNAGDKLAYSVGNSVRIHNLTNGLPTGSPTIISATSPVGLEFNNSGSKLFYTSSGGVNVYNLSTSTSSSIASTSSYASGMLEKSFEFGSIGSRIICGNASALGRIDPATNTLDNSWSAPVSGLIMPDQIDGEDVDDKMFNVILPSGFVAPCGVSSATFTVSYRIHPYILAYYASQFAISNKYIGDWTGPYAPQYWTTLAAPSISQTSVTYTIYATSSYRLEFYKISNPTSCPIWRSFSFYIRACPSGVGNFNNNPNFNPTSARVVSDPNLPIEETILPGFKNSWVVSELDPETYFPKYAIARQTCWETSAGQPNEFIGFDAEKYDYESDPTLFSCSNPSNGTFLYNRTYMISRMVWADAMDPTLYTEIFTIDDPTLAVAKTNPFLTDKDNKQAAAVQGISTLNASSLTNRKKQINQVTVYPNPSTDLVYVKTNLAEAGVIEVYKIDGTKVFETTVNANAAVSSFDLSPFATGLYFVKIKSGSELQVQKVWIR